MKIFIPTNGKMGLDEKVAEHFGRCEFYTVLDEEGKLSEIIDNISRHRGGASLPPELLKKHGADVLLCRGLGMKAIDLFEKLGIDVYVCPAETVAEIYEFWKNKNIKKAGSEDACKENKS